MKSLRQPLRLNFDDSTGLPAHSTEITLNDWQERIRFGCKWRQFKQLEHYLAPLLPAVEQLGCVLLGSGDYHHLSQLLLARLDSTQPIHLIICDNHPDHMRYPFGIHCGSWVYWASRLAHVARIDVIGISSEDIALKHAWENHWLPLIQGKVHYWSIQQSASWTRWIGAKNAWRGFANADDLMQEFLTELSSDLPIYLSIDKDVLSETVVQTNWDQGHFLEQHVQQLIAACKGRLIGADITGDVSAYHYQSRFKRLLSASDGQIEPTASEVQQWQIAQIALNQRLIEAMASAWLN
ncbi:hypothetical protein [Acinetobacter larvae]|uniref:Arginase n=1 Tax=Acinetobacter larvae TaxID=1789224 RepID=A0A1B2LX53_9GAMM|nr:hypothetical protein [Acinetobacter larvae]AOA57542.1 hypothetical protein BFG52_03685 [Acinetobacter larvae]